MNCPICKTSTVIALSPVSWFCYRCGKFHTDFRALADCSDEIEQGSVVNVEEVNANEKEDFSIR